MIDLPNSRPNHFVNYVLRGRAQIRRRARSEAAVEFASYDAIVKSRLSMHVVKANTMIKVINSSRSLRLIIKGNYLISNIMSYSNGITDHRGREGELNRCHLPRVATWRECSRSATSLWLEKSHSGRVIIILITYNYSGNYNYREIGNKVKGLLRTQKKGFTPMSQEEREEINKAMKVLKENYCIIFRILK